MTFNIVAMICVAGMAPQDCAPEPGFSRDVAVIGQVSNELWCGVEAPAGPRQERAIPQPRGRRVHQNHVRQKGLTASRRLWLMGPERP
jgi:hypothetical protein